MPSATYPFSEKYGWVEDKYGVIWQLNLYKSDDYGMVEDIIGVAIDYFLLKMRN